MNKFVPRLIEGIILILIISFGLYLRIALPYDQVFSGDWIKFAGPDAYYHMRLIDNFVYNFPHLIDFDPYMLYPGGVGVSDIHFFDWLLGAIIWVIGLGSPSQHSIDVIGAYFPAFLGALTAIPVYFIGKELFGRWAGVIAAVLIVLMPSEFLGRSILGFTDHHVAETLFSTVTILFLILAIKATRQRGLTFKHLKHRDWSAINKPLIYSLIAGFSLGVYLLTWGGALLFVFIIFVYFVVQFIIDHLKHKSADYLCFVGVILFLVALTMFVPVSRTALELGSLGIAMLTPLVLSAISRLLVSKQIKLVYYPLSVVGLGLAGLIAFHVINPSLLGSMLEKFSIFKPGTVYLTVLEMQPLLFHGGNLSLFAVWGNFTTGFFLSLISLSILIYIVIRHGTAEKNLLIVWSLIILATTLGQRRFAYYFAVNVALLTGYLSWQVLSLAGLKDITSKTAKDTERRRWERTKAKLKKSQKAGFNVTMSHLNMALAIIAVFFLVFFPNIKPAIATAKAVLFVPSDGWVSSLSWLKANTPDPFGDPAFYYDLYEPSSTPKPAYGVASLWDSGYWITRIGHRVPNANPGQGGVLVVSRLFLSQDEEAAGEIMQRLLSKYVIIDYETVTGKFCSSVTWARRDQAEFYEVYYQLQGDRLVPISLFYPEYYRSLATRLYNFDGREVNPDNTLVVSYQEKVNGEGEVYKQITGAQQFDNYEEALSYVEGQQSANYRIVGDAPFISPVPLRELKDYKLIYSSESLVFDPKVGMVPEVKIFEYVGAE